MPALDLADDPACDGIYAPDRAVATDRRGVKLGDRLGHGRTNRNPPRASQSSPSAAHSGGAPLPSGARPAASEFQPDHGGAS